MRGIVIENTLKNSPMFLGILQMPFKTKNVNLDVILLSLKTTRNSEQLLRSTKWLKRKSRE
jgi:hypothetical protein